MLNRHKNDQIHWKRLAVTFLTFLLLSAGLGYLLENLLVGLHIPEDIPAWSVYLIIFGVALVVNLSVIPLPFATVAAYSGVLPV